MVGNTAGLLMDVKKKGKKEKKRKKSGKYTLETQQDLFLMDVKRMEKKEKRKRKKRKISGKYGVPFQENLHNDNI